MTELSGVSWIRKFPGSNMTNTLKYPFRKKVEDFISALNKAGAKVVISATFRPPERAYLMHWSWMIMNYKADYTKIPVMKNVDIDWDHKDKMKSINAARVMGNAFEISNLRVPPALQSRHTDGLAIDMDISWSGDLSILDKDGKLVKISTFPRDGMNKELQNVAKSFGVIKIVVGQKDKPHWSSDGH